MGENKTRYERYSFECGSGGDGLMTGLERRFAVGCCKYGPKIFYFKNSLRVGSIQIG